MEKASQIPSTPTPRPTIAVPGTAIVEKASATATGIRNTHRARNDSAIATLVWPAPRNPP